jgi:plastocyanin
MTLRWHTCFKLSAVLVVSAAALKAANVSGTVQLKDSSADSVNKRRDYSGVVVSLTPVNQSAPAPSAKHAVMLQKNKMFTPHILPVLAGSTVDFPNSDPIFHNAFSSYSGQIFDVGLYPPGTSRSVRFVRPGVVRVFCNIHPSMSSVILVLNTPYFISTVKDGSFQLDVPPGIYELNVFHERSTETTLHNLTQRVVVTEEPVKVLQPVVISEGGFLHAPHKNKYGKEYTPAPDDKSVYPGVRN